MMAAHWLTTELRHKGGNGLHVRARPGWCASNAAVAEGETIS